MLIIGLDLAGVETRPTGVCILRGLQAKTCLIYSDEDILKNVEENKPRVVAIDAPLSLPAGRESIEERTSVHLRDCDKELMRRRIKFFPITLGPMRKLTSRGMKLKKQMEDKGFSVIEVYPGGAQDVLGIPRKRQGLEKLRVGLEGLGFRGLNGRMSDHELDAVTCALVGKLYLERNTTTYGTHEQAIIMPKGNKPRNMAPSILKRE